jgi:microcystin-dependent protein
MDGFLAQILLFGGDFAPSGWAFCRGQLLPISQHATLFAVIGTRYGGDGTSSFALPDLRSLAPGGSAPSPATTTRVGGLLRRRRRPGPATPMPEFVICIEGRFPQRP